MPVFGPYHPHGPPIMKLPKPDSEYSEDSYKEIIPEHQFIKSPRRRPPLARVFTFYPNMKLLSKTQLKLHQFHQHFKMWRILEKATFLHLDGIY